MSKVKAWIRLLELFKDKNRFITIYEVINFIKKIDVYSEKDRIKYQNLLDYWSKRNIIVKVEVKSLLREKLIDPNQKIDCKYMYCLGQLGLELMKIIYPNGLINYNRKIIVVPFYEAFMRFNQSLCAENKYKYRKETFIAILSPDYFLKFGRYYYVVIAEDPENLKKILSFYPKLNFQDAINLILKTKLNQKLKLLIFKKIFSSNGNNYIYLFDFVREFINICRAHENDIKTNKILKIDKKKKGGVVNG